ncbi:MAG: hypothetical protein K5778_01645 [Bacteroidaceae bacterium]|nr:hypothetical protein [Bacteroidaceae bacterium]
METRIITSSVKSNRSNNNVWAVSITGESQPKAYCKSPYKAMRFAFLLKQQTGIYISDDCLQRLLFEMAKEKQKPAQEPTPVTQPVSEEKPVKKRVARAKKSDTAAVLD